MNTTPPANNGDNHTLESLSYTDMLSHSLTQHTQTVLTHSVTHPHTIVTHLLVSTHTYTM